MGVSKNRGTPKSSILIRFSIINHPFWGTTILGNTHIYICILVFHHQQYRIHWSEMWSCLWKMKKKSSFGRPDLWCFQEIRIIWLGNGWTSSPTYKPMTNPYNWYISLHENPKNQANVAKIYNRPVDGVGNVEFLVSCAKKAIKESPPPPQIYEVRPWKVYRGPQ